VNKQWAGVQWGWTAVYALGAPADVAVRAVWGLGKTQGPGDASGEPYLAGQPPGYP
jgi:hypothetical protein